MAQASYPTLSIVIVSFNTKKLTLQTLNSVVEQLSADKELHAVTDIIVIDNNSSDGSVVAIEEFSKRHSKTKLQLIKNSENKGFGAANNQGIKESTAEFVFFLNSDTELKAKALQSLLTTFTKNPVDNTTSSLSSHRTNSKDRLGLVAAQLSYPDGSLQPQGGDEPTLFSLANQLFFLDDIPLLGALFPSPQHTGKSIKRIYRHGKNKKLIPLYWVAATALMARRSMLDEIGLFDEHIFMYGEDVELCIRAQNHLWDVVIQPEAEVVHYVSQSSSSANAIKHELLNYIYIWSKHHPLWQLPFLKGLLLLGAGLKIVFFGTIFRDTQKTTAYSEIIQKILTEKM